ncbi:P-loop containing nucleoside triphosphate hydrolase [Sesbania bispinosa]|nr:P-loop containing nucleoside triphosphate hydrolase [Sesbania bispinosa]
MGATGTGKTKLAIDVAKHFQPAEIVNSDKIQVYKGLDITTNKVTEEECAGVPHHLLGARVDRMIEAGQVEEVREFFDPFGDYTRGIRRAIGVPEFDDFLKAEANAADERTKKRLLEAAIARIKINNCTLANRQLQKIHRLYSLWKRSMHRLDATESFLRRGCACVEAWENHVLARSLMILHNFLYKEKTHLIVSTKDVIAAVSSPPPPVSLPAVAAVTH